RTRRRDRRRARLEHLTRPLDIDAGPSRLLHPHPATARAAAEGVLAALLHLGDRDARSAEDRSWRLDDAVVPRQVARVVDGDASRPVVAGRGLGVLGHGGETAG